MTCTGHLSEDVTLSTYKAGGKCSGSFNTFVSFTMHRNLDVATDLSLTCHWCPFKVLLPAFLSSTGLWFLSAFFCQKYCSLQTAQDLASPSWWKHSCDSDCSPGSLCAAFPSAGDKDALVERQFSVMRILGRRLSGLLGWFHSDPKETFALHSAEDCRQQRWKWIWLSDSNFRSENAPCFFPAQRYLGNARGCRSRLCLR